MINYSTDKNAKLDNGKRAHKKKRKQLAEAGLCKIEVYADIAQKGDVRTWLNENGFDTALSQAVESAKTDTMKKLRENTLRKHFMRSSESPNIPKPDPENVKTDPGTADQIRGTKGRVRKPKGDSNQLSLFTAGSSTYSDSLTHQNSKPK